MKLIRPLREESILKRLADLWPYILIAISIIGLVFRLFRGTL